MISFDLRCPHGHVFETWFRSSADYEAQRSASQLICPFCSATDISKAVMAPQVAPKGNRRALAATAPDKSQIAMTATDSNAKLAQMIEAIASEQAKMIGASRWVGEAFAQTARAMQRGEQEQAIIHGRTSAREAQALFDEGVLVAPLLIPFVPPDEAN
jgi:hypothetical protein